MHRSLYSESVPCSPDRVWAFIGDLRNDRAWRREITDVEVLEGTPPWAPTTYRETIEWAGTRSQTNLVVTESVKGSRVVVIAEGSGFSSRSAWTFEPHGELTTVTLSFAFETSGALRVTEGALWRITDGWLQRDLPLLQGHLSCDPPAQIGA